MLRFSKTPPSESTSARSGRSPLILLLRGGRFVLMASMTVAATVAMYYFTVRNDDTSPAAPPEPTADLSTPRAMVAVQAIRPEQVELYDVHSGKIRAWEYYTLGFELAGRVVALGENENGQELDEGDRVKKGQMLARLDERVLKALKSEAVANLEQAESDLKRAQRIKSRTPGSISETELQQRVTNYSLTKAALEIATTNLDDAELRSPVDAVIARRWIKTGESVNAHEPVFELVQTDEVVLVLNVPESKIPAIELREREIAKNRKLADSMPMSEDDLEFYAQVTLLGTDHFRRNRKPLRGTVYHVSETAMDDTGLFEVEIRLDNRDGLLKPGMIATARIVTGKIQGYLLPESSLIVRGDQAGFYTIDAEPADVEAMFFKVGQGTAHRSRLVPVDRWVEQDEHVVVPLDAVAEPVTAAIVRGQRRLVDNQLVKIVEGDPVGSSRPKSSSVAQSPPAAGAN